MRIRLTCLAAAFIVVWLLAGCGNGTDGPEPGSPSEDSKQVQVEHGDGDVRAVYEKAAAVLEDPSLSYSDRRNHLRLVRRSFGDDLFSSVIGEVPVIDAATGRTVSFDDFMADLAGTFVGHPQAPISFDPVGAATRIYFSPTEDTIRRMTGIGVSEERVQEYSAQYRGVPDTKAQSAGTASETGKAVTSPPPAFVSRDPKLKQSYERARRIFSDPDETEESRREQIRIMRKDVGQEALTLILRYVPVIDLEKGTVQTFDDYMREQVASYDTGSGSLIHRDPVGAGMSLLFDSSMSNIKAVTGVGLSSEERREAAENYRQEQADVGRKANRIVAETSSQFDWKEVHKAAEDLDRDINRATEDINQAAEDIATGIISILGGN